MSLRDKLRYCSDYVNNNINSMIVNNNIVISYGTVHCDFLVRFKLDKILLLNH